MSLSNTMFLARDVKIPLPQARPIVGLGARLDALLVALIFIVGIASRLPFRSQFLYHWDSVNFALAIERFDLSAGQPHPPGYLLYVALARLVDLVVANPPETLVMISVISSGLSGVALFLLGMAMFDRTTGIVAALFLITSPLFWFYGEVALPHALDTFLILTAVYLLYRSWSGEHIWFYPASIVLAVAGGLRPQTLAFLLPLWLYVAMRVDWAGRMKAGLLLVALCIAWLVPLLWVAGGLSRYKEVTDAFSASFRYFEATTLLLQGDARGLVYNLDKLVRYTAYASGLTALLLVLYARGVPRRALASLGSARSIFLAVWVVPSLLFYVFVHMGQQGLVFVFFPALVLLSAEAIRQLSIAFRMPCHRLAALVGLILVVNSVTFLYVPQYLLPENRIKVLSRDTINATDAYFAAVLGAIRDGFPSEKTILVGADWRQIGYYLPEYRLITMPLQRSSLEEYVDKQVQEGEFALDGLLAGSSGSKVVFFDRGLQRVTTSVGQADSMDLANGDAIWYVTVDGVDRLRWTASRAAWSILP